MKPLEEISTIELKQMIEECHIGYRDASEIFEFETAKMYKERIMEYKSELAKRRKNAM